MRPRIFLEGNYFVDLRPGSPERAGRWRRARRSRCRTPRRRCSSASSSRCSRATRARTCGRCFQEYGKALDGPGGRGFNRSIQYWEPAFKNSALVNDATARHRGARPLELPARRAQRRRGPRPRPRGAQGRSSRASPRPPARSPTSRQNLSATIRELPTTLAGRPARVRRAAQAFPPVRRLARAMLPTVRTSGPALDAQLPLVKQLRRLVAPAGAPGPRQGPAPDRAGADRAQPPRRPAPGGDAADRQLQQQRPARVERDRGPGPELPGPGPDLPGGLQAVRRPRRREPQLRRQRPVRPLLRAERQLRVGRRRRPLLLHRPARARRQPAEGAAPAGVPPGRPVRDAGGARTCARSVQAPPQQIRINQNAPGRRRAPRAGADRRSWSGCAHRAEAQRAWTSSYTLVRRAAEGRRRSPPSPRRRAADEARDPATTSATSSRSSR